MTRTKKGEPVAPLTFADIARKRIHQQLTAYRAVVEKAVAGEQLTEGDMASVFDCLEKLQLPTYTFERDVQGSKDHARNAAKAADAEAREPELRERGRQIADEIATLTKRLNELKAESHRISVSGTMKVVGYIQRLNELKALHPHVLLPLEAAVEVRAKAMKVDTPSPEPAFAGRAL